MNWASLETTVAQAYRLKGRQWDPLGLEEGALTAPHDRHASKVRLSRVDQTGGGDEAFA